MQTRQTIGYAATIGFFDGVHRGHQFLIRQLKEQAAQRGLQTMAVTFARHPRQVVATDWQPRLLSTLAKKQQLLEETGIDRLEVLDFNKEMAALPARAFMQQVLKELLDVRLLLIGYDNRFGHNREEGFDDYVRHGKELGIEVVLAQPLIEQGTGISSSLVRRLLDKGDVEGAAQCLGRIYTLAGTVVSGKQIGRKLGFPTANLQLEEPQQLVPENGAYAVSVRIDDEQEERQAMMNIGRRPTFNGETETLEIHIFDFQGNLYGHRLSVGFQARLRGELRFDSPEALKAQLEEDARECKLRIEKLKN